MSAHILYSKKPSTVLTTFDKHGELNFNGIDSQSNTRECYIFYFCTSSWKDTTFLVIQISGWKKCKVIKDEQLE